MPEREQYILLINGPLTAGKTSLIKVFLEREPRLFRVAYDVIKRQISDFDSEADRELVGNLLLALSKSAIEEGLSIVIESSSANFRVRDRYFQLAKQGGLNSYEVNVEAPLEVLLERLAKRVEARRALTVTEPEQLIKRYNLYLENKNEALPTYDTSKHSPEEVYTMIKRDILA